MWKLFSLALFAGLVGCASMATTAQRSELSEWSAYRATVLKERDQGKLTPVEAEERIQVRYQQLYGLDPVMDGAFAYGITLYKATDTGDLSLADADQLAQTRVDQALAHREQTVPLYVFPPEPSD